MSLPMVISMVIQALYNIVDSMYVSQINEDAPDRRLPGLSHADSDDRHRPPEPAWALTRCSPGAWDAKIMRPPTPVALHGVSLALISGVVFAAASFLLAEAFMGLQTSDPEIFSYGVTYMRICCTLCFGVFCRLPWSAC